jgi:hypothetical protein
VFVVSFLAMRVTLSLLMSFVVCSSCCLVLCLLLADALLCFYTPTFEETLSSHLRIRSILLLLVSSQNDSANVLPTFVYTVRTID